MTQKIANKSMTKKSYSQKAYLGRFPYNLVNSGNLEKYYKLLTDFNFLAAKIKHPELGVQALIDDYDLISDSEYNLEKVKALKLIQGGLRLSAHILARDKTQLAGQLWGRMQCFKVLEIQAMLSQAEQSKTTWLRPLTTSLTPPGGRLLRTLTGHSASVNALAVTPDGQRVISGSWDKTLKVWSLATAEELFTLTGHSDWVNALAVTPDGQRVISGSRDKTLKVWGLSSRQVIANFTGDSPLDCCAVAPDGLTIVAGEQSGRVHFLRLEEMGA